MEENQVTDTASQEVEVCTTVTMTEELSVQHIARERRLYNKSRPLGGLSNSSGGIELKDAEENRHRLFTRIQKLPMRRRLQISENSDIWSLYTQTGPTTVRQKSSCLDAVAERAAWSDRQSQRRSHRSNGAGDRSCSSDTLVASALQLHISSVVEHNVAIGHLASP